MFQVLLLCRVFMQRSPLFGLRRLPQSPFSPKLTVLMMVILEQYRSINVVKYIVGSVREKKKMEK